jgi:hypothetical protein
MPELACSADEKYEGFDIWVIRNAADSLKKAKELKDKPEMLKAVEKYLQEEQAEIKAAIDLGENL